MRAIPLFVPLGALLFAATARAEVVINEFDRGGALDNVELYNSGPPQDLTGWQLENGIGDTIDLDGMIGTGGFRSFGKAAFVPEGGQIELLDGTAAKRDEVAYGDQGGAPLPPPVGSFSCARHADGADTGNHATDWTLDRTKTLGASNTVPSPTLGARSGVMNELGRLGGGPSRSATCIAFPRVELYNRADTTESVTGWFLTDGRDTLTLSGTIAPESVLVFSAFPGNFCFEQTHVIYLFDEMDRRVDQWGIAGTTLPGATHSWQRVPDGSGPFDGWNYATSGGDSTMFVLDHTFGGFNPPPVVAAGDIGAAPAAATLLLSAAPNPFRTESTVLYDLPGQGRHRISIHDAAGRNVATLATGEAAAGRHAVIWDGSTRDRRPAPSGVYFVRLEYLDRVEARAIVRTR
ncbi:MAG: FlgD immunoglobulin-like domain containing protein [Candidatus Eiseniibacteriota bacterium]